MLLLRPTTGEWPKPKAKGRHYGAAVRSPSSTRIFIINALLGITTATMATIALGSIASQAMPPPVNAAAQSANSPLHSQSNYRGVDAVSALTGLSNGYMQSYYHQLRNAAAEQQQHQHPQSQQPQYHLQYRPHSTELVDKESTGRGLQLHASHYGNGVVGGHVSPSEALELFNVPDSGFIPTTMSAAGQHYASSFPGLTAQTDKNNGHVSGPTTASATANAVNNKNDLQQSAPVSYSNMVATTTAALSGDNNGEQSLYGRLSNYDELNVGRSTRSGTAMASSPHEGGMHNFALAYDNYAVNLYNDPNTNEAEQQQNFVNYFTPTKSAAATTSSATAYGTQSPYKYLPLTNYHNNEHQQQTHPHHHYQPTDKQHFYSRTAAVAATAPASTPASEFYGNYNHPNNVDGNSQQLVSASYQTRPTNYYATQQQLSYPQRQFKEDHDYKEPEMAESAFVVHTSGKRSAKNKSKRSDPLPESYDSYAPEHSHQPQDTEQDDAETIQLQQNQLEELHQQLRQQQQQFVTLQHQLIDHDQQLQIQKHQAQYQAQQPPTLPPVTRTIQHNPLSLQALSGTPLSKHTHVVRTIPVPQHQKVYVPTKQNVNVEVPDPIITTIPKPMPIEVPVSKTIAIPQINEVKIPIEKVRPFPVERPIPYIVEKRVPYAVEKQVAKPVYYHVPIKVPIVHTVVHKVHSAHPYSYYQHQKHQHIPSHYAAGPLRHVTHHGGYGQSHLGSGGHSHLGGGNYLK